MKVVLVYAPFAPVGTAPYSIYNLFSFLKNNSEADLSVLDLNLDFHKLKFPSYQEFFKNIDYSKYEEVTSNYLKESSLSYSENNRKILNNTLPELFDELYDKIVSQKPDVVAFSVVFSSQAFYTKVLIEKLNEKRIKTVVGGPAVNQVLSGCAKHLNNEIELLKEIRDVPFDEILNYGAIDFSNCSDDYFSQKKIIPLKMSSSCYYRQCAFCTHHQHTKYYEFPLEDLKKTIEMSNAKYAFFVDDMIHKKRLLEIAKILKPLGIKWICQLKPSKDLDLETLQILYDSGMRIVFWGVESANDRILKLMKKSTNKNDITKVITDAHEVGIKNVLYIMFGFPSETKEEFLETIEFLKENDKSIDLISTSIFGLQKGSPVFANPKDYGISEIIETKRTVLEPKIEYEVLSGLSNEEASELRKNYKKTLEKINKYPKSMNFFREHMLLIDE